MVHVCACFCRTTALIGRRFDQAQADGSHGPDARVSWLNAMHRRYHCNLAWVVGGLRVQEQRPQAVCGKPTCRGGALAATLLVQEAQTQMRPMISTPTSNLVCAGARLPVDDPHALAQEVVAPPSSAAASLQESKTVIEQLLWSCGVLVSSRGTLHLVQGPKQIQYL